MSCGRKFPVKLLIARQSSISLHNSGGPQKGYVQVIRHDVVDAQLLVRACRLHYPRAFVTGRDAYVGLVILLSINGEER